VFPFDRKLWRELRMAPAHADQGTLIIIPTYNERDNVEAITTRALASVSGADVLIVDDGSPDGTGEIADRMAESNARVQVMHRTAKAGLGAAYVAGFKWGLESGYSILVEMDADGSHAPEQLPELLRALEGADLVLRSRWVRGARSRTGQSPESFSREAVTSTLGSRWESPYKTPRAGLGHIGATFLRTLPI